MKQFDTVEKALDELKQGHLILVTDDEDRENEGDLICAASFATTENVNFMATQAIGIRNVQKNTAAMMPSRISRTVNLSAWRTWKPAYGELLLPRSAMITPTVPSR